MAGTEQHRFSTNGGVAPTVIVIGDVVTDLVVRLGSSIEAASDTTAKIETRAGGSGANTAAWLAHEGVTVHFIGRVGRDAFGAYHEQELRHAGVTPHLAIDDRATGAIVVLVDHAGERHMLADRGANLGLREGDLPTDLFKPGRHLHLSGYTLFDEATRPAALAALTRARSQGMTTSVDPSSVALLRLASAARFLEWTHGVDLCFPNLDEGLFLAGVLDPLAAAKVLGASYGAVVLTQGAAGALWARRGEETLHEPAPAIDVVDSTGAGDAFCAAFLAAWLAGAAPAPTLRAGTARGALAATTVGGRPPRLS